MCYETSLTKTQKVIENHFKAPMKIPDLFQPSYHQSGFSNPYLYVIPQEDPSQIYPMEWGLIAPFGERDIQGFRKKYNTLNAKSETVLDSRMYQKPTLKGRCLIIADGFFEPHHDKDGAQPYYCYLENRQLFTFAGIYTQVDDDYWSASILTTSANPFFEKIHNKKKRMPLVLDPSMEGSWIDDHLNESQIREILNDGFIQKDFEAHPVSKDLYKRGINTNKPQILERV